MTPVEYILDHFAGSHGKSARVDVVPEGLRLQLANGWHVSLGYRNRFADSRDEPEWMTVMAWGPAPLFRTISWSTWNKVLSYQNARQTRAIVAFVASFPRTDFTEWSNGPLQLAVPDADDDCLRANFWFDAEARPVIEEPDTDPAVNAFF